MRPFPHYSQTEPGTSGLICLQIICKHYGTFYNLEHLKKLSLKKKKDTPTINLRETAETLGLRARIAKVSLTDLKAMRTPCIIEMEENTFVVLFKGGGVNAFVSDPASSGLRKYPWSEFIKLPKDQKPFCLFLEPTPEFSGSDSEDKKKFSRTYLLQYLKPYRKLITQVLLGFFAGSILGLLFPILTQSIVDIGIGTANVEFITLIMIAQITLIVGQAVIEFIRNWVLVNVSLKMVITLISDFLIKLMKLPMGFFDRKLVGDLRQRMDDNARIEQFLTNKLIGMLFGVFIFVMYSIVLGIYDITLLLIFYFGSGLYFTWIVSFLKRRRDLDLKRFSESVTDQNKVFEMFTGMKDIKLNQWEVHKRWEWEAIQIRLLKIHLANMKLGQYQHIGGMIIAQLTTLTISFISAISVTKGEITIGAMVAIQFIIGQLYGPITQAIQFIASAQDMQLSLQRIQEINNEPDESTDSPSVFQLPSDHSITVNNLTFGYSAAAPILKNIQMHIPQGKVTAIVGESGSGKTTMLKLLLRYFNTQRDEIRIGNASLADIEIDVWRSACGAVMQDSIIFSDTILNNIALNHSSINNKQLEHAVHVANIKQFIEQLPLGYETVVGQGGMNLSQGQKQRLLIARVIYRDPSFLFFDESTNALDSHNEAIIVDRLNTFFLGRTVVIVAHRLSTIRNADQIVVFKEGKLVEVGNHDNLFDMKGHYYSLIKNQLEFSA